MKAIFFIIAMVLLTALHTAAYQQSLEAKLKQSVNSFGSQSDSTIEQLVELAQHLHIPMGIEWADEPTLKAAHPIQVYGVSGEDVLHQILQQQPGYSFTLREGVVHIYKPLTIDDPHNFLNIRFPEFGYKDESLSVGSYRLRLHIQQLLHPNEGVGGGYGGFSAYRDCDLPTISFSGKNLTVRQILSKMVAMQGNAL